jgi:PKD repeat protein
MRRSLTTAAITITAAVAAASILAMPGPAVAADPLTFAVIGDVPYGPTQFSQFPTEIAEINADPAVQTVFHVGDISSPLDCSDSYYSTIRGQFNDFADPMVYTPGDNEWTDCSRAATGAGNPLERLAALRSIFFATPGVSLGQHPMAVSAQAGYPENVTFEQGGLTFATLHVVGSNNDLNVWSGSTTVGTAQKDEVTARTNAVIAHIHTAFANAAAAGSRSVVFLTQADMFIPGTGNSTFKQAFQPIVKALAADSLTWGKPVFLLNGDTHTYLNDQPLTTSKWMSFYGTAAVPNLTRITVQGGTSEWAKVTVVDTAAVLQVQRIPYGATPPPPPPPAANVAPTATFSSSAADRTASFDASASQDSDGTIASYSWDFGDGTTGSGKNTSHPYAAAGTYSVTLTVTDDDGAAGTVAQAVTVTNPQSPPPTGTGYAADSFSRTTTGGFGTADTGGAWTTSGTAANFSVSGGTGRITAARGSNMFAYLPGVSSSDTEVRATASFARPTAGSVYVGLVGRRVGANTYGARVVVSPTGTVQLHLQRNTDTVLRSASVPGLTFSTGDRLQYRLQVLGTSPTTIQAKVWKVGAAEPAAWQASITDATAALQSAGSIGLYSYLGSSATPTSIAVSVDDLWAGPTGAGTVPPPPAANAAPTAAFSSTSADLTASFDGSGSQDSDGTIASYSWNFGDSTAAGSGANPSHLYAAAGTYPVTLTVTDDDGATGAATREVTVTAPAGPPPPAGSVYATDSFSRSATGGFGTADTGGPWTITGTAADFSVNGAGTIALPRGANRYAYLAGVSSTDTEVSATAAFSRPSGGSVYVGLIGRRVGANTYGARAVVGSTGSVQLHLQRNTDTVLRSVAISGLTFSSGDQLRYRLQVTGTSPTTIQAKVWKAGSAEPATWQASITDATSGLQSAGSIGLYGYLSGSATPTTLPVSFDELRAGPAG